VKLWSQWREMNEVSAQVRQIINTPLPAADHAKLFRGVFAFAREAIEQQLNHPREPTAQDQILWFALPSRTVNRTRTAVHRL